MVFKTNHPKQKGIIAEEIIKCSFLKNGITVLIPIGDNERYDFVVYVDKKYLKIQCKLGRISNGKLLFSSRSVSINRSGIKYFGYKEDIDFFAVFEPNNEDVFLIPVDDVSETTGSLRIDPPKNNQIKKIKYAKDYLYTDTGSIPVRSTPP